MTAERDPPGITALEATPMTRRPAGDYNLPATFLLKPEM
jgi:hypothetical protein